MIVEDLHVGTYDGRIMLVLRVEGRSHFVPLSQEKAKELALRLLHENSYQEFMKP